MRTLVDIPDHDLELLNSVAHSLNLSRAELIRRAIADSLAQHRNRMDHAAFGLWAANKVDGLDYQNRMREEW
jgi:metal-responsive CopG/Arc/MetJ family transcriptional regulator